MNPSRRFLAPIALTTLFAVRLSAGSPAPADRIVVDDCYHAITTVRDMYSLAIALEAYGADHGKYPVVQNAGELSPLLAPAYIMKLDVADAWGTLLRYEPTADGKGFRLISAGSDRKFDEASWPHAGVFTDSKEDAVWSNHFVRKWAIDYSLESTAGAEAGNCHHDAMPEARLKPALELRVGPGPRPGPLYSRLS